MAVAVAAFPGSCILHSPYLACRNRRRGYHAHRRGGRSGESNCGTCELRLRSNWWDCLRRLIDVCSALCENMLTDILLLNRLRAGRSVNGRGGSCSSRSFVNDALNTRNMHVTQT